MESIKTRHFAMAVAYDGAGFHGWQRQPHTDDTVQGSIERVLLKLLQQEVLIRGAGRTDAGVHALAQWATFSAVTDRPQPDLERGLNALLPAAVRVRKFWESAKPLDALRQSRRKTYFYQLHTGSFLPPHRRRTFCFAGPTLDLEKMRAAARILEGEHDFRSFATEANRQRSCVRHLHRVRIMSVRNGVRIFFTAHGFLYNMVRALSAALVQVGQGRWTPDEVRTVLEHKDRSFGPATAPAHGLFLFRVDWDAAVTALLQADGRKSRWTHSRSV